MRPKAALGQELTLKFEIIGMDEGDEPRIQEALDALEELGLLLVNIGGQYTVKGEVPEVFEGLEKGELGAALDDYIKERVRKTRVKNVFVEFEGE